MKRLAKLTSFVLSLLLLFQCTYLDIANTQKVFAQENLEVTSPNALPDQSQSEVPPVSSEDKTPPTTPQNLTFKTTPPIRFIKGECPFFKK